LGLIGWEAGSLSDQSEKRRQTWALAAQVKRD
jgi:hypothetical protein